LESFTNGAKLVYLFNHEGHLSGYLYYPA
jgi:hypothetical protein